MEGSKRSFSQLSTSSDENTRPSKLAKLGKKFVGILSSVKNRILSNTQPTKSEPDTSLKPQVTARQLAEFYEQVKAKNNSQMVQNTSNILGSEPRPAESTGVEEDSIGPEIQKTALATSSFLHSKESEFVTAQPDTHSVIVQEKSIPPPPLTFGIDPLRRSKLIALKRRMKADRYQRNRTRYLQEHTKNLVHTRYVRSTKNPKYINTAVNTRESSSQLLRSTSRNVRTKLSSIPASKRNTNGLFMLSMAYSVPDDDDETPPVSSLPQMKPASAKLKFSSNQRKTTIGALKPRQVVTKKEKTPVAKKEHVKVKPVESAEKPLEPTAAFKFATTTGDMKPPTSSSFSFNIPSKPSASSKSTKASKPAETAKPAVPSFSFNPSGPKSEKSKVPSFSFGKAPEKKAPTFNTEKKEPAKSGAPVFSFGKPVSQPKKAEVKQPTLAASFGAKQDSSAKVPVFGSKSGSNASTFSFKPSAPAKSDSTSESAKSVPLFGSKGAPVFNMTQTKASDGISSKTSIPAFKAPAKSSTNFKTHTKNAPAFSFGNPPPKLPKADVKSSNPQAESTKPTAPAFSFKFGGDQGKKEQAKSSATSSAAPAFTFGQPKNSQKTAPVKPAFSFNTSSGPASKPMKPASKPTFTFGKPIEGAKADNTPLFVEPSRKRTRNTDSGSKDAKKQPAFNFGGNSAPSKPQANAPVFKMDSSKVTSSLNNNTGSNSGFNFGAKSSTTFGNNSAPTTSVKKNSSGSNNNTNNNNGTNSRPKSFPTTGSNKTGFGGSTFGQSSQGNGFKPASSFIGKAGTSSAGNGFKFGGNNGFNTGSTGFGSGAKTAPSSGFGGFGSSNNNGNNSNNNNANGHKMFNLSGNFPVMPASHLQGQQNGMQNGMQNGGFNFGGRNNGGFNNGSNGSNEFGGFNGAMNGGMSGNGMNGNDMNRNGMNSGMNGNGMNSTTPATNPMNMNSGNGNGFHFNPTPNFNFAGNDANKDPASIFSGPPAQPVPRRRRKMIAPHPLRRH